MLNQKAVKQAMGQRDRDFIELKNAWASVSISRTDVNDVGDHVYNLSGDCDDQFDSLSEAMARAVAVLGEYQEGRAD